jgi:hypothetical protein
MRRSYRKKKTRHNSGVTTTNNKQYIEQRDHTSKKITDVACLHEKPRKKNNLQSLISSLGTWRSSVAEQATEKVSFA